MKFDDTIVAERSIAAQRLHIPAGLLGLEHIKEYELVSTPEEEPFTWLQSAGVPDVAFLLVSPFLVADHYQPDISDADAIALGLSEPSDAVVFNIVTLRAEAEATVNLKGPIIINRRTNVAKQVVLHNASDYSVRHPIIAT